jgi:signal transduction histidine kinase/iron only hydrogenase large subunit-like protein
VRECPAKAIKVEQGQATVIEERCIACGNCVKVCAQQAKLIEDSTEDTSRLLQGNDPVFAILAPSFPAAFHPTPPGKVISAVRELGFKEVWEVAFGAELVGQEYAKLFEQSLRTGSRVITTPCPAIVAYVEKYMPSLHGALAPIVSPMIAVARAIRHRHGPSVRIVFVGPCIAKKNEIRDPFVAGTVNIVLTYKELTKMFEKAGLMPDSLVESQFDGPRCHVARSFPISGGLLKTAGLSADVLENNTVISEGKDRVLSVLKEVAEGQSEACLFDVLFCEGCISGPKMLSSLSILARKEILANFVQQQSRFTTRRELAEALAEFKGMNLSRSYTRQNITLPQPKEEDIVRALRAMRKFTPEDELNCGACGYASCREKATAVCQGLAEPGMCLPYLVQELEDTCERLSQSHQELASAQQRLVHSEKLASMGQLSAAVAHEINNPLVTVLTYSHMLLKELQDNKTVREDLTLLVSEATRCRNIVRGLLDFARQSRVSKAPSDLAVLLDEVLTIMESRMEAKDVRITTDVQKGLPLMMIDADQVKQMLVNLIQNGVDAIARSGEVRISAHLNSGGDAVDIKIKDTGGGIAKENLSKLFTPFFTTKALGKGTGLGLAIAYGIVKMHSGDISVESEVGKGTTFSISLPVGGENKVEGSPKTGA